MMTCQKHLFNLDEDIHYLNGSYMSPLLKSTVSAGMTGMLLKSSPNNVTMQHFLADVEVLRGLFARLINVPVAERVAIIPSVSYGMAVVAKNIKVNRGQNIVLADAQFPSNVYPWCELAKEKEMHIKTVAYPNTKTSGSDWTENLLAAIDSDTALVALAHVHWANGIKYDLEKIGARAREVGALFVLDGTQCVGALTMDVEKIKPDALICGGYKWLMGPYTLGYAYFNERFDNAKPLEENWINRKGSEDFTQLVNYRDEYQPFARRFDMGERSNFINVPMGIAAITQILEWGTENIQTYLKNLTEPYLEKLRNAGCIIEKVPFTAHHLIGIGLPKNVNAVALSEKLKERKIFVSVRGEFVRLSPHVYNDDNDMAIFTETVLGFGL